MFWRGAGISNHPLSGRGSPLWGRLLMSLLFRGQELYWLADDLPYVLAGGGHR